MNFQAATKLKPALKPSFVPTGKGALQRKCACGGTPGPTGECEECRKKRLGLQRRATSQDGPSEAPAIVHEVLRSPGQPLDPALRAFMEPRFGHDFSTVRVHTDAKAVVSAQAVNALAYTVGSDIVFAAGRYSPSAGEGRELLAHELTHVVQQGTAHPYGRLEVGPASDHYEAEAAAMSRKVVGSGFASAMDSGHFESARVRRQSDQRKPNPTAIQPPRTEDARSSAGAGPSPSRGAVKCPSPESLGLLPADPHIPSGSLCRGACGPDCPSTCTADYDVGICAPDSTGACHSTCTYSSLRCGSHQSCRDHDACYDRCAARGDPLGLCHRGCDLACIGKWGPVNCWHWMRGNGPYDNYLHFYTYRSQTPAALGSCRAPIQSAPRRLQKQSAANGSLSNSVADDAPAGVCRPASGIANSDCSAYASNAWWLPLAYVNNATCACATTPNSTTGNCVRKFLQDRLAATPTWLKTLAAAQKLMDLPGSPLYSLYQAFVQTTLTPRIYQDHRDAYAACCCSSGPAAYPAWIGVTTVPIQPCSLVGLTIRYFGSCHGTPGRW